MAEKEIKFDDGPAYERYMGAWSRAVGAIFLDWVAPPKNARWLDLGCGTGAFTSQVLERCAPEGVTAVDPSPDQVEHARRQPAATRADFRVADAQALPFDNNSFDVVASALVINFIPDRPRAIAEMKRVARADGIIAGYVWDFAGVRGVGWPLIRGMRQAGIEPPVTPGTESSTRDALHALFSQAGLQKVETREIEVTRSYPDFEDYWTSQTPKFSPNGRMIAALSEADRSRLKDATRGIAPTGPDGRISYPAWAHAVKARAPG
jgi:ubiquinone/menaquinone biosynthesis C-methylase UbiE